MPKDFVENAKRRKWLVARVFLEMRGWWARGQTRVNFSVSSVTGQQSQPARDVCISWPQKRVALYRCFTSCFPALCNRAVPFCPRTRTFSTLWPRPFCPTPFRPQLRFSITIPHWNQDLLWTKSAIINLDQLETYYR